MRTQLRKKTSKAKSCFHRVPKLIGLLCLAGFSSLQAADYEIDLKEVANLTPAEVLKGKTLVATERTKHPDAQWFKDTPLGLFIHWGPVSSEGLNMPWRTMRMTEDPKDSHIGPIKKYGYTPPTTFWKVFKTWNPDKYDPDKWMEAAQKAGFGYAVLTTKHHLGYALWPSKVGNMGVSQYLNGRDLVRPYVDACRKHDIKVGFYYSGIDWHFEKEYQNFSKLPGLKLNYRHERVDSLPERTKDYKENVWKPFNETQGREVLTQYGKIDLWWPDGTSPFNVEKIRKMQPGIVINNRMDKRHGDYATPEAIMIALSKDRKEKSFAIMKSMMHEGYWWENCIITNKGGSWFYQSPEGEMIYETGHILWKLGMARSFGGNILANISPRPDGSMPDQYYRLTGELEEWMAHSRESLTPINGGGVWPDNSNVPVTVSGDNWYLHSPPVHWKPNWGFTERIDTIVLNNIPKPKSVVLLRTNKALDYTYDAKKKELVLTIPTEERTKNTDVVKLVMPKGTDGYFELWQKKEK
jgi:alpha-L-fucosidase